VEGVPFQRLNPPWWDPRLYISGSHTAGLGSQYWIMALSHTTMLSQTKGVNSLTSVMSAFGARRT
jgi:hypothetical protein